MPVELVDADGDRAASSIGVTLNPATALTLTITDDEAGTANIASGSILYTFQFSEIVTGFDAADITVVNGTKGTFTAVDGDTYTLVVTPTAGFQGILTVGVAAGVAFDAAATPNAAALSVQVVDTLAPAVAVDIVEGSLNDGVTGSFVTFAFSEAPGASFTESDIQLSAGLTLVAGSLTMVDATHYTATVTANDGFTGNATVSLVAGSYTDAALNLGLGGSDTVTVTMGAPPVLDLDADNSSTIGGSDYSSTFTRDGPVPITDVDVKITDPDSTTMASATIIMFGNGQHLPDDKLEIIGDLPGGITSSGYNPTTGELTLTGVASIAEYQSALHQIEFSTTDPSTADRIISVTVNDGANTSNTAQTFMHVSADLTNPLATVDIAANLLTEPNASSLVTIHFTEPVAGFDVSDLTASGGVLSPLSFQKINGDTYQAIFTADPHFDGTGTVILTGAYTDLALNPGITGATDTVDVNTLASTLDATIVTNAIPLGQAAYLTFVDLQNPIFSYAGLYTLDAPGDTFLRDAGFDINPSKEYAVSLEPANGTLIPLTGLVVEGITIHGQPDNQLTVGLELDNDNSIVLDQTALTAIIQPNDFTPLSPNQKETTSFDGNEGPNQLFDPAVASGIGADFGRKFRQLSIWRCWTG